MDPSTVKRVLPLLLAALSCAGIVVGLSGQQSALRAGAALLPVTFSHRLHTDVNCLSCPHNFADGTGSGLCLECHRAHPAVAALRESQFHGLCRDCHAARQSEGLDHGPLRECSGCHQPDVEP